MYCLLQHVEEIGRKWEGAVLLFFGDNHFAECQTIVSSASFLHVKINQFGIYLLGNLLCARVNKSSGSGIE